MASTQGSTFGSFNFTAYIDESQMIGETVKEDSAASEAFTFRADNTNAKQATVQVDSSVTPERDTTVSLQPSTEVDGNEKLSITPQNAPKRPHSSEPEDMTGNGRPVLRHPDESAQRVSEPVKRPLATPSSQSNDRSASPPPCVDSKDVVESKKSQLTPPASTVPTSSYSLRSRTQSKLVYDVKYHPMDDAIRPSQAAKRRSAHGEKPLFDVDDSSEASSILETDAGDSGSSDAQSEEEEEEEMPKRRMKGKTHKQTKSRPLPTEGVRRSTRKVSDTKTSYNMDVHPQDKYLVISSDDDITTPSDKRKKLPRKRPNAEDSSESENQVVKRSKTHHRKRSRSTAHDTSGRIDLDSSGAPVSASVETGSDVGHRNSTIAVTPTHLLSIASPPGHGIRRREGMDVWHYPPGKRYLNHDRDYWPVLPGEAFEIFQEKLEDQLAREAMEASPLNYEHDNKENSSNAGLEPLTEEHERMSVIPVAQYRQSSDERRLADHHSLVSNALYFDEPPQSYGLDGTHSTLEVEKDDLSSCMEILASGQCLPTGQTPPKAQTETQDSVLGPDLISDITGPEA